VSGYCPDCGNTLCICKEIEKDGGVANAGEYFLISKDLWKETETKIQSLEKQVAILKEAVEPCKNSLHISVDDILKMREALKQIEEMQ